MIGLLNRVVNVFPPYREYRRWYWFGIVFALFFFAFTLLSIVYAPTDTKVLMRHAGVFFAHLGVVGFFLFAFLGVYALFFWFVKQQQSAAVLPLIIFFAAVFIVILFLSPPFFSSDAYGYISRAAIANIHHANPYQVTPAELGYSSVVAWPDQISVYGPLFINFSLLVTKLVGPSVVANLMVFRLLAAAAFLMSGWLVYRIVSLTFPQYRYAATALFAWNPFFLFEAVHSAHNDAYMVLGILAAIYLLLTKRYVWATLCIILTFVIKFSTAVLLPIVALLVLRLPWHRLWRTALLCIGVAVVVVAVAYLPLHNFDTNIGNLGRAFITDNNLTLPQAVLFMGLSWLDSVIPSFEFNLVTQRAAYLLLFVALYLLILFRRGLDQPDQIIKRSFWILLLFLFLLGGKFNVWYTLWFAPLVLLVRDVKYHALILFVTLYGFMYYASLNVFFPNVIFSVAVGLYFLVVQWDRIAERWFPTHHHAS